MFKFQTPQGVKDELFNEYEKKQRIIKLINDTFKSFGYREAFTPTIEYYDVFSSIKSTVLKDEMFKLIDKSGEILVLRPDVTIPIARMIANNCRTYKKNFKVFYNHQVFRMNNEDRREFTQTGVEFFGSNRPEADAEIISIAIKSLLKVNVDFHIEIGHANYYKGLLEEINIDSEEVALQLKELIENKNFVELERLTIDLDLDEKVRNVMVQMPKLYGNFEDVLKLAKELCLNDKMCKAVDDLKEVYEIIKDYGYDKYISVDLGLINHLDYYTGVIFKGYMAKHGDIILSGGRYDKLTENYGEHIPATGFGITIDELINGMEKQNGLETNNYYIDYKVIYKIEDRKEAFKLMELLRDRDFIVESDTLNESLKEITRDDSDIKRILILDKDELEIIDRENNTRLNIKSEKFIKNL